MSYQEKYLKYKKKYLSLKNKIGGSDGSGRIVTIEIKHKPENIILKNIPLIQYIRIIKKKILEKLNIPENAFVLKFNDTIMDEHQKLIYYTGNNHVLPIKIKIEYTEFMEFKCAICGDPDPIKKEELLGNNCGCRFHIECFTRYIDSIEPSDKYKYKLKVGFRCPNIVTNECLGDVEYYFNEEEFNKLLLNLKSKHLAILNQDHIRRLKYMYKGTYPECIVIVDRWLNEKNMDPSPEEYDIFIKEILESTIIIDGKIIDKNDIDNCIRARNIGIKDRIFIDVAENILLTSKPCSNCDSRLFHFQGHDCHSIKCQKCLHKSCFVCCSLEEANRQIRGRESNCRCPYPNSHSFCPDVLDIDKFSIDPYPHIGCGCPPCNECKKGQPCGTCRGNCIVCLGKVPPGPFDDISRPVLEKWLHDAREMYSSWEKDPKNAEIISSQFEQKHKDWGIGTTQVKVGTLSVPSEIPKLQTHVYDLEDNQQGINAMVFDDFDDPPQRMNAMAFGRIQNRDPEGDIR